MNITQPGAIAASSQPQALASRGNAANSGKETQANPQSIENNFQLKLSTQELKAQQENQRKLDEQEAKSVTEAANTELASLTTALAFSIDRDIDRFIVKLVDTNSQETLRQYPAEEMVEVFKALKRVNELMTPEHPQSNRSLGGELSSGLLFRGKA